MLLGETITDLEGMRRAGARLFAKYQVPFLLKGGHLSGDVAIDLLFERGRVSEFSAPFARGVFTHGTGCTYSAAIAANLARGSALSEAVQAAKAFVTDAIAEHFSWTIFPGADVHALNHLR
jgi:hydroxymethylpyrimidine/phosphomethylpyrimidine kinase